MAHHTAIVQNVTQHLKQIHKAGVFSRRHIEHLSCHFRIAGCGGQQISLNNVGHITKISARGPISIDEYILTLDQRRHPFGNHGGVVPMRILPRTENIEITQAHRRETVTSGENLRIQFIDVFGHRVGRERIANHMLNLGQARVVSIGGTACGIDHATDAGIFGRDQHVQKSIHIGRVCRQWIFETSGYRAQCSLMQHMVHTLTSQAAVVQIPNVTSDHSELFPTQRPHQGLDLFQISLVTSGKVIQTDNLLIQFQKRFKQIGTNEPGNARDQPSSCPARKPGRHRRVNGHIHNRMSDSSRPNTYFRSNRTLLLLAKERIWTLPILRNWSCATATMTAS